NIAHDSHERVLGVCLQRGRHSTCGLWQIEPDVGWSCDGIIVSVRGDKQLAAASREVAPLETKHYASMFSNASRTASTAIRR
ncbi:MAG: hypothetical protein RLY19_332, partial [Actinomycetota bacterium]